MRKVGCGVAAGTHTRARGPLSLGGALLQASRRDGMIGAGNSRGAAGEEHGALRVTLLPRRRVAEARGNLCEGRARAGSALGWPWLPSPSRLTHCREEQSGAPADCDSHPSAPLGGTVRSARSFGRWSVPERAGSAGPRVRVSSPNCDSESHAAESYFQAKMAGSVTPADGDGDLEGRALGARCL